MMSRKLEMKLFLIDLYHKLKRKDPMEAKMQLYRNYGVKIGKNVRSFSHLMTTEPYLLEFGDNTTVSFDVVFITHDNSATKVIPNASSIYGRIKVGKNCFIGARTVIMPGVELGDNVIVGAGSVVTKSFLEDGTIIAGNPAKVVGSVEKYREKYADMALNPVGMSFEQKRDFILKNESRIIKK